MKILLDPLYTSKQPGKCASNAKFKKLALHILEKHPDAFIYWAVPSEFKHVSDALFYPDDPRIHYFMVETEYDRYREYRRLYYQREKMAAYYGEFWDWDLMVTNRTTLVPFYKQMANHHSSLDTRWSKRILLLEDFPQMSFKTTAAVCHEKWQDMSVLLGYLAADRTAISAYWEKAVIIEEAKKYLAPAMIKYLRDTISEATPVHIEKTELKDLSFVYRKDVPFTIGWAGRLSSGHQLEKIFDVMEKNWIIRHDWPVKCLISTQSQGGGVGVANLGGIPKFIETHYANRELFHKLMREQVHVGVFFSKEEDYSMSLLEPMFLGVPYAVIRAPWSEAALGPDYPFFFKTQMECYTIIKAFHDSYAAEYARFAKWSKEKFEPLLRERNKVSIFTELDKEVAAWRAALAEYSKKPYPSSTMFKLVVDEMKGANVEMAIEEALRRSDEKGKSRHISAKLEIDQFDHPTTFSTDRNLLRLKLMAHELAIDCKPIPGVMRLP